MTVKELFETLDIEKFTDYYLLYESKQCNRLFNLTNKEELEDYLTRRFSIKNCIEKILSLDIVKDDSEPIVFSINSDSGIDSFVVHKQDLLTKDITNFETYAYEFCEMSQILGYEISNACRRYLEDDYLFACSILYEMTFFGYEPEKHDDKVKETTEDLNKQVEEIENGTVNTIPAEEIFKEFNWVDERKSYEKSFDLKVATINGKHYNKVLKLLVNLERKYIEK